MVNELHVNHLLAWFCRSVVKQGRKARIKLAAMQLPAQVDPSCNGRMHASQARSRLHDAISGCSYVKLLLEMLIKP